MKLALYVSLLFSLSLFAATSLSEYSPKNKPDFDLGLCVIEYKIVVVPTIVILNEGEEMKRFQANIMMTMEATKTDVQEAIDEVLMSSF